MGSADYLRNYLEKISRRVSDFVAKHSSNYVSRQELLESQQETERLKNELEASRNQIFEIMKENNQLQDTIDETIKQIAYYGRMEISYKNQINELERKVGYLKKAREEDKINYKANIYYLIGKILRYRPFRRAPVIIYNKDEGKIIQTPASRILHGNLKEADLTKLLDFTKPREKQIVEINKLCTCIIYPIHLPKMKMDLYAIVAPIAPVSQRVSNAIKKGGEGLGKEIKNSIDVTRAQVDALIAKNQAINAKS